MTPRPQGRLARSFSYSLRKADRTICRVVSPRSTAMSMENAFPSVAPRPKEKWFSALPPS